ncbi:LacI family DNA-binding transcriptional regulator [soil metagenome]
MTQSDERTRGDESAPRSANIFDVARLAGVSHQTVSRVLNDLPNVRPATRARVESAIAQLRYSPSPAARALVTRRTRTIGLIAPGNQQYGPASITTHFNFAARAARYSVDTVLSLDNDPANIRALVESLLRQRVDAIVLIVVDVSELDVVRGLEVGIPLIAVAASARHAASIVSIDQYRGARNAVRHLIELGHTRVLHLAGPPVSPDAIERVRGWRDEVSAHRLEIVEPLHGDWSATSGYELTKQLQVRAGDAVFVSNDHMAIGLMSALREAGLVVPDDVSVVGFDDLPESAYLSPPLTTVRQDFAALGGLIMQKVLIAVEEPDSATESTPLATTLVVRGSTRPQS